MASPTTDSRNNVWGIAEWIRERKIVASARFKLAQRNPTRSRPRLQIDVFLSSQSEVIVSVAFNSCVKQLIVGARSAVDRRINTGVSSQRIKLEDWINRRRFRREFKRFLHVFWTFYSDVLVSFPLGLHVFFEYYRCFLENFPQGFKKYR